jgi:hypothetical protein
VLRGARDTLERAHPLLFVSIHPDFMQENYGDDANAIFVMMAELGYHSHLLADVHEEHWLMWHPETHGDVFDQIA